MVTIIIELLAATGIILALYLSLTAGRALFQLGPDYHLWRRQRRWQQRRKNG
jgi:succinate dehydrogenase hydrophobic anchor subunit